MASQVLNGKAAFKSLFELSSFLSFPKRWRPQMFRGQHGLIDHQAQETAGWPLFLMKMTLLTGDPNQEFLFSLNSPSNFVYNLTSHWKQTRLN